MSAHHLILRARYSALQSISPIDTWRTSVKTAPTALDLRSGRAIRRWRDRSAPPRGRRRRVVIRRRHTSSFRTMSASGGADGRLFAQYASRTMSNRFTSAAMSGRALDKAPGCGPRNLTLPTHSERESRSCGKVYRVGRSDGNAFDCRSLRWVSSIPQFLAADSVFTCTGQIKSGPPHHRAMQRASLPVRLVDLRFSTALILPSIDTDQGQDCFRGQLMKSPLR